MVARSDIQAFADKIAEEFRPQRIILFGSHARGEAGPDSDVDILVVMNTSKRPIEQAVEIRCRIDCDFALDLLVRTPQDVRRRLRLGDFFLGDVFSEGKVLYERSRR